MNYIKGILLISSLAIGIVGFLTQYNMAQDSPGIVSNSPVQIIAPQWGATLIRGQAFNIEAEINPQQFHVQPQLVEVELFHVLTKYSYKWQLDPVTTTSPFKIKETLTLPHTTPLGNDAYYRLRIGAATEDKLVGLGHTIPVKIVDTP